MKAFEKERRKGAMTKDLRGADVIDSRDVIARLRDLENSRGLYTLDSEDDAEGGWTAEDGTLFSEDWSEDEEEEYQALKALDETAEWPHGETLISEDYFEQYAEQLAEDIGVISRDEKWPLNHIDWEAAADELLQDYTSVEFNGDTYYIRA